MQPGDNGGTQTYLPAVKGQTEAGGRAGPVVAVPRRGASAYAGPILAVAALISAAISPVVFAVVLAAAAVVVASDVVRALDARTVAVPRILVYVLVAAIPLAALKSLALMAIFAVGSVFAVFVWGMRKIQEPGLADALAGGVMMVVLVGIGYAHGTLIATGEFKGGPVSAKYLAIICVVLIIANSVVTGIFAAATINVGGVRGGSGNLFGLLATVFVAFIVWTLRHPPVGFLRYMGLGLAVAGACTAARLITSMFLTGAGDPEEIVDPLVAGEGFALQALLVGALALPAAYYVARWLFV